MPKTVIEALGVLAGYIGGGGDVDPGTNVTATTVMAEVLSLIQ